MKTTNRSLAVFLWTFRRKWKGLVLFIAANAALILLVITIYPEFSEVRGKAIAEALGGDMEVSLTEDSKEGGDYTLRWGKYGGADGYVVVESDTEIPLPLITDMGPSGVNLPLLATLLPTGGRIFIHTFDAATTETSLTGLDERYGSENPLVYFGVLAFRGDVSNASIEGASHTVNTRDLVARGPLEKLYEKLQEHPLMKAFVGGTVDVFSIKGFLCVELFTGLTSYIIIYFLIQYAGAFSSEMEQKTIDIILSTPLSRRAFFVSRYLSWAATNLIFIVSWIMFIYIGVLAIGEEAEAPLADIARTMILSLPFMLTVQGFCMLASVVTNDSRKAYGACFGIYFGMVVLRIVATLSQRLEFVKYLVIVRYWDYSTIFIDGIVPWGDIMLLTILSLGLFIAGLTVFEKKDLPS